MIPLSQGRSTSRTLTLSLLLAALAAPVASYAKDWDTTRQTLIDPLNSALHSHWPTQLQSRELDTLVRLYVTKTGTGLRWDDVQPVSSSAEETMLRWAGAGGEEPIRERYEKLLALFADISRTELRIGRVDWRNPDPLGYRTTVHLIVRGTGPEGDRRQLEQYATLRVRYFDPFWEITQEEVTARTLVSLSQPRFEWAEASVGIDSIHQNEASPPFRLFGDSPENPVRQASGVAVGDADRDGCEDLVLAGSPDLVFYRSRCDGTFEDATREVGLPRPYPAAAGGVVFLDYDNDGWPDLFVAAVSGGDRLFHNDGTGRFVDVSRDVGVPAGRWGGMPVVADYDRDGFLDIYVSRMGNHEKNSPRPPNNARNGERGTLLHNRGDGTFEEVSKKAGVDSPGWDMAAAWGDYDGDGWPDLYVANEFGNNRLYHNDGDGTFTDRTAKAGVTDGGSAMGASWGDIDGDGDLDLFVSGMHSNSGWALFHPDFPMPIPWYFKFIGLFTDAVQIEADIITDRLLRGSSLFRNDGDGSFTDISDSAGVRDGQWGWAGDFLDYDNDGRLDLYAVNGFISGPLKDDL
jgi:hypothetical protein